MLIVSQSAINCLQQNVCMMYVGAQLHTVPVADECRAQHHGINTCVVASRASSFQSGFEKIKTKVTDSASQECHSEHRRFSEKNITSLQHSFVKAFTGIPLTGFVHDRKPFASKMPSKYLFKNHFYCETSLAVILYYTALLSDSSVVYIYRKFYLLKNLSSQRILQTLNWTSRSIDIY